MPISDEIIFRAVERYDRERDRYLKLASRVADLCRSSIVEGNAIRAQVTSRTKTVRSFEGKLHRFAKRENKNYLTVDEVFDKIGDFAGVRVATYRPEDEQRVSDLISEMFAGAHGGVVEIDLKNKLVPNAAQFYRATHCQVYLRDEELVGNYENLRGAGCEIQVCSMMAHVWNEIEHDIGYKPDGGSPSANERGLLEGLGHLTRSGDAVITQLLAANEARMEEQKGDFTDVHDFVARLRSFFPNADLAVNAGQAFDEARLLKLTSLDKLVAALGQDALRPESARQRVSAFNGYLSGLKDNDLSMNVGSSDLITISMLDKCADRVLANHPTGRGKGRPPRIYYLAQRYKEYRQIGDSALSEPMATVSVPAAGGTP